MHLNLNELFALFSQNEGDKEEEDEKEFVSKLLLLTLSNEHRCRKLSWGLIYV